MCRNEEVYERKMYEASTESSIHTRSKWDCRTMQPCSMYKCENYVGGSKVERKFWAEAVNTAVHLKNISPTKAFKNMTPEEA